MGVATTITADADERAERRTTHHEADLVVVGAGVFGCAIAFALANQGRSVILLERSLAVPDRIVGELLQPGGVESLAKLGLRHCLEDIDSVPCYGYDVLYYGDTVPIPYPYRSLLPGGPARDQANKKQTADSRPPTIPNGHGGAEKEETRPEGRCFHHGRFIDQLRKSCLRHPNISVFETEAVGAIRGQDSPDILGIETRTLDKATGTKQPDFFFGQLTIAADGYRSLFRNLYVDAKPVVRSRFYALELIDCPLPHPGNALVVIGASAPVLLYQIGTHETRALIDVPERLPEASLQRGGVRGYMTNVVLPILPEALRPSFRAALDREKGVPRCMPNSWLPPTPQGRHPGLVVLGDAMNMRHPLTGGGMTVALNDVVLLTDLLSPAACPDLGSAVGVRQAMASLHWRRKRLTSIINVLAQALYALFAAQDPQLAKLQRGCFGYFERGVTDDPMGLLAGLIHSPLVLAYHFFSVAFLAVWLDWKDTGLWNVPLCAFNAARIVWTACVVFLPVMWRELN